MGPFSVPRALIHPTGLWFVPRGPELSCMSPYLTCGFLIRLAGPHSSCGGIGSSSGALICSAALDLSRGAPSHRARPCSAPRGPAPSSGDMIRPTAPKSSLGGPWQAWGGQNMLVFGDLPEGIWPECPPPPALVRPAGPCYAPRGSCLSCGTLIRIVGLWFVLWDSDPSLGVLVRLEEPWFVQRGPSRSSSGVLICPSEP